MSEETLEQADQSLPEAAQSSYREARDAAQEWEQGLESYIRQQPLRAVLMAAGAGVLLALLFARK